jgi:hypothetical protein
MYTSAQGARALGLSSTLVFVATVLAGAALAVATPVAKASHGGAQAALPLLAFAATSSQCPCNTGLVGGPDGTPVVETSSRPEPPSQCPCNLGLPGGPGAIPLASSTKPLAVPSQKKTGSKVTVRITGTNDHGDDVTNGGVAGHGNFTASGAITDKGTVTAYRTVKGAFITLRFVSVGTKGTITFVVKIDTDLGTSRWTISSGTKAYKGLHGKGTERENIDYTVSTLTGTVSR